MGTEYRGAIENFGDALRIRDDLHRTDGKESRPTSPPRRNDGRQIGYSSYRGDAVFIRCEVTAERKLAGVSILGVVKDKKEEISAKERGSGVECGKRRVDIHPRISEWRSDCRDLTRETVDHHRLREIVVLQAIEEHTGSSAI